jgi:L-cysteine S-thiosulfotransferase
MKLVKNLLTALVVSGLVSVSAFAATDNAALIKEGKKIFMTKKLGNCSACHALNGVKINAVGSLGPKLSGLKDWPAQTLYNTIYDIYAARGLKISAMPAFGRDGWLSDQQIKALVAFLKTIN